MPEKIFSEELRNKWLTFTLAEQMGNIGSEVGRALSWQKKGQAEHREKALERAFELMDLTLADRRWASRLKELARARETMADYFYGDNEYGGSPETLDKYFYYFAVAARIAR